MGSVSAETAYLFRHALVRSAAYELQLPGARAELHALVVCLGMEFWGKSDDTLAPYASDLADHAQQATTHPDVLQAEVRLLRVGASTEGKRGNAVAALKLLNRLAACEVAPSAMRAQARLDAAQSLTGLGRVDDALLLLGELLASATTDAQLETRVLLLLSACHSQAGRPDAAVAAAAQAEQRANLCNDKRLMSEVLTQLADLETLQGQLDAARQSLGTALELADAAADDVQRAKVLFALGTLNARESLNDEAEECFRQFLDVSVRQGNVRGQASSRANLALCARLRGQLSVAEAEFIAAAAEFRKVGHVGNFAGVKNFLGNLYLDQGKLADALRAFDEAIVPCREHGLLRQLSLYEGNRALVLHKLGQHDEALGTLEAAVRLARAAGDTSAETTNMANLAALYDNCGRHEDAEKLMVSTAARCKETGNRRFELITLANLAGRYAETGRLGRCRATLEHAATLASSVSDQVARLMLAGKQAKYALCVGDAELFARAKPLLEAHDAPPSVWFGGCAAILFQAGLQSNGTAQHAFAQLQQLRSEAERMGLGSDVSAQNTLAACEEIAHELERAAQQGRKPLLFRGFQPGKLTPQLRLALLDHMRECDPQAHAALTADTALHRAMLEGTDGIPVPDWRDELPV